MANENFLTPTPPYPSMATNAQKSKQMATKTATKTRMENKIL